jgi:hypothetical protein
MSCNISDTEAELQPKVPKTEPIFGEYFGNHSFGAPPRYRYVLKEDSTFERSMLATSIDYTEFGDKIEKSEFVYPDYGKFKLQKDKKSKKNKDYILTFIYSDNSSERFRIIWPWVMLDGNNGFGKLPECRFYSMGSEFKKSKRYNPNKPTPRAKQTLSDYD